MTNQKENNRQFLMKFDRRWYKFRISHSTEDALDDLIRKPVSWYLNYQANFYRMPEREGLSSELEFSGGANSTWKSVFSGKIENPPKRLLLPERIMLNINVSTPDPVLNYHLNSMYLI